MSRGGINMDADMNTRMPSEFRDLYVAVVLALAVIAQKNEEESNEQGPLLPQIDKYFHLIPSQANHFLPQPPSPHVSL